MVIYLLSLVLSLVLELDGTRGLFSRAGYAKQIP